MRTQTIFAVSDEPGASPGAADAIKRVIKDLDKTYTVEVITVRPRVATPPPTATRGGTATRRARAAPKRVAGAPTIAGRIRELIKRGGKNDAVWATVKREFDLPESKRGYVAGQRKILESRSA